MFFGLNNQPSFPFDFGEQNSLIPASFAQFFGYPQQQRNSQRSQRQRPNQRNSQTNHQQRQQQENVPSQTQNQQQQRPAQPQSQPLNNSNNTKNKMPTQQKASEPLNQTHALYWKNKGNQLYKQGKLQQAIEMYSRGIHINDSHSILYSNRAKCYKQLGMFQEALSDVQASIDLDDINIKAYLIQGQLLAEIGKSEQTNDKIELAIVKITKALRLCTTLNKPEFKKDILMFLRRAQKLLWLKKYQQTQKQKQNVLEQYSSYLSRVPEMTKQLSDSLIDQYKKQMTPSCSFEIPDGYICKVTYDLMEDPVITQSGHTYERSAIEHHIKQNGNYDPFTRQAISTVLYPNLLVKSLIDEFLSKNPWAYEHSQGETYRDIKF